ncbi:MAG: hypothetical protein NTW25_13805 [Candidatus Kapabacteria bacterium]|nr:hypothetical protein [Candidatus Kapabacteria bacterium]
MNKLIKYLIIFNFIILKSFADDFETVPLNINLKGLVSKDDKIITYGDYGSYLESNDNGRNWQQKRAFKSGNIVKLLIEENRYVAICSSGKISISKKENDWVLSKELEDSIYEVKTLNDNYVIRCKTNLFILNSEMKIVQRTTINVSNFKFVKLGNSMAIFQNKIIIAMDSSLFLMFDNKLKIVDSLSAQKLNLSTYYDSYMNIHSDSLYFYFSLDTSIFRSKDFKSVEKIYHYAPYFMSYKVINNKLIICELLQGYIFYNYKFYLFKEDKTLIKISDFSDTLSAENYNNGANDFEIKNDSIIIVGDSKLIIINKLSDSKSHTISNNNLLNIRELPYQINDTTFLFFSNRYLFLTNDNGVTYKPKMNVKLFKLTFCKLFNYDVLTNCSIFAFRRANNVDTEEDGYYKSFDLMKNYNQTKFKEMDYTSYDQKVNFKKSSDEYITGYNIQFKGTMYNKVLFLDSNLNFKSKYLDSLAILYHTSPISSNLIYNFLFSIVDSCYQIVKIEDNGLRKKIIYSFQKSDSLLSCGEFNINNNTVLNILTIDKTNNRINNYFFDLKDFSLIKKWNMNYIVNYNYAIDVSKDTVYFALNDTIYSFHYLKDYNSWEKFALPKNGFINKNFKKFGDRFFARYVDDDNPDNIYWLKFISTPKLKSEIEALDIDFGNVDIKEKISKTQVLNIGKKKKNAELIITGYSKLNQSVFLTDLPKVDVQNPLIIQPNTYYHFQVQFKPNTVIKYLDSIVFYSNAVISDSVTYIKGEGIDTLKSSVIEDQTYFYSYPPYPLPARNELKSLIYWDMSYNIDDSDIGVYDIYGNKVADKGKLSINKLNAYSGYLSWDCSGIATGVYMIQIKHGTNTHNIRAMVVR